MAIKFQKNAVGRTIPLEINGEPIIPYMGIGNYKPTQKKYSTQIYSCADAFGNANGMNGPSASGVLGFALVDSEYADRVIVVTDNLVPFPCVPWQIQGNNVDYTVLVDKVGLPDKIVSGTTEVTKSPDRLLIAEITAKFCDEADAICGISQKPNLSEEIVAVIKWVDGTVIDVVRRVIV